MIYLIFFLLTREELSKLRSKIQEKFKQEDELRARLTALTTHPQRGAQWMVRGQQWMVRGGAGIVLIAFNNHDNSTSHFYIHINSDIT